MKLTAQDTSIRHQRRHRSLVKDNERLSIPPGQPTTGPRRCAWREAGGYDTRPRKSSSCSASLPGIGQLDRQLSKPPRCQDTKMSCDGQPV